MHLSHLFLAVSAVVAGVRAAAAPATLLLGHAGMLHIIKFSGTALNSLGAVSVNGSEPVSMVFIQPMHLFWLDQNANTVYHYAVDLVGNNFTLHNSAPTCQNPTNLALAANNTRLIATCAGGGDVNIYDITGGKVTFLKAVHTNSDPLSPGQTVSSAKMSTLDGSDRFVATTNTATDTVIIIDSAADSWSIVNRIRVPTGCGPTDAVFYPPGANVSSHYILVCTNINMVQVYAVKYQLNMISLTQIQSMSTLGQNSTTNTTTARGGAIAISSDALSVYVSTWFMNPGQTVTSSDTVTHFNIIMDCGADLMNLQYKEEVPVGGLMPRTMIVSAACDTLFVGNCGSGTNGLVALPRYAASLGAANIPGGIPGGLLSTPYATVAESVYGAGPMTGPASLIQVA